MDSIQDAMILDVPKLLEIEPTRGCNLRCIMCHVPHENGGPQYLDLDMLRSATKGITDLNVIIGSEYEPTIHPRFEELLKLAIDRNWKVDFLTNGVNLHKIDKAILSDVNFHVFNVSFDGASENTFSKVRVGGNYSRVLDNIIKVSEMVRNNGSYTAVNSTLLGSNLHEVRDMVRMWEKLGFDLIRLFIMQVRSPKINVIKESLYSKRKELIKALERVALDTLEQNYRIGIRSGYYGSPEFSPPAGVNVSQGTISSNSAAFRPVPGVRQDIQSGRGPGMQWPCRSPFVYCRIRWDGEVDLCNNRSFVIGNIAEKSLHDCWTSHVAWELRQDIQSDSNICRKCDYFRFCINAENQDITEKESHFSHGLLRHTVISNL
jgi:radical SAM protein with 4Fe4S-binding SPASM domain